MAPTQEALYRDIDLELSWSERDLPERERTKHVHRLHPYLGKFIPQLVETLLHGIAGSRAQVAILDITGVSVVDTQVANGLLAAAQAVRLLGSQVILTGIRPEIAQILVSLNVDMRGVITCSSLQSGIALAMKQR